jgi:DNA-directed RNA polymerase specialized sigma24 family protein
LVVGRFDEFAADAEPRLRRALVAAYGPQAGADAVAAALAYGWEHWARVATMTNPIGYLYRVGQSAARRELRVQPSLPIPPDASIPDVEPSLIARLNELSEPQRVCVLLVHAYQWRQQEVADLLEIDHSTVRTHIARALERLRSNLEADHAN